MNDPRSPGRSPAPGDAAPLARLRDAFWERHANPLSGWSRLAASPALLYAVYRRDRRLIAALLAFLAVNPVLFPRPKRTDAWMSRAVRAERAWIEAGNGTVGLDYPNALNALNVAVSLYALLSAVRRRPRATALGTAAMMALKLLWIDGIVDRTEGRNGPA